MSEQPKLTVFFDGSCPLCAREIGFYRRLDEADAVSWVDISSAPDAMIVPGLAKVDAMRKFHVLRADGRISSGGIAFAHLWAALPGLGWIGRFFLRKPFSCVLDGAYTIFLPARPVLQRLAGFLFRRPSPLSKRQSGP